MPSPPRAGRGQDMVVDCGAAIRSGVRHVVRAVSHYRIGRLRRRLGHAIPRHAPVLPAACRDTDAPFRALRRSAAAPSPSPMPPLAKTAAAAAAAATGAGLGYRALSGGAMPSSGGRIPTTASAPAFVLPSGTGLSPGVFTPQSLVQATPAGISPDVLSQTPGAVPEPASSLVMAAGLAMTIVIQKVKRRRDRD